MVMIAHNKPLLGPKEEEAALEVLRSGWLAQGNQVKALEEDICEYLALPQGHAVALTSGSAALYLALMALDATGHSVASSPYSCRAVLNAIELAHAIPEWIDTRPDSPNIDSQQLLHAKASIAIVPHMFGIPAELFQKENLRIIEDCCQAIGAEQHGHKVGTSGDIGIFSFAATKLITTGGQGGMLVSRNPCLVSRVRRFRDYDCPPDGHMRFNFQMTDLQAAIGRCQLQQLPRFLNRREILFNLYTAAGIPLISENSMNSRSVRFRAVLRHPKPDDLIRRLEGYGIKAIVPVRTNELLGDQECIPEAVALSRSTISIPLYPALTDSEVEFITSTVCTELASERGLH